MQVLVDFYGKEATVDSEGETYTSPALVDGEEVFAGWRIFKRAMVKETKAVM